MPKTYVRKSAVKTQRNSEKARIKNKSHRNALATLEKTFRAAAASDDKAVKVGVIHQNKANRKKSRLAALAAGEKKAE